ncbi:hypothetical protein [Leptolyngbya ohadii]|uniref:hypothetical protein n=1 Tax=Leptolyngbya ohadii TaxID=1962290 RepID=UPI00117AC4A2|nr:hypothetical protein [Leptolyngbya ohadii]
MPSLQANQARSFEGRLSDRARVKGYQNLTKQILRQSGIRMAASEDKSIKTAMNTSISSDCPD